MFIGSAEVALTTFVPFREEKENCESLIKQELRYGVKKQVHSEEMEKDWPGGLEETQGVSQKP